ncbi:hypothetical protein D3C81_1853450 [compost metagenome]
MQLLLLPLQEFERRAFKMIDFIRFLHNIDVKNVVNTKSFMIQLELFTDISDFFLDQGDSPLQKSIFALYYNARHLS